MTRSSILNPQSSILDHIRLAYFIPLAPSKSGIADYNSELLPHLAKGAEISVFVPVTLAAFKQLRDMASQGGIASREAVIWDHHE
jgi:hypothetical protein